MWSSWSGAWSPCVTHYVPGLCNMFFGLSFLFVYTNLERGRMVADSQSPLLRAIPVCGNCGDATHEFRHIHYTEAAAFNSDVVKVNIRRGTGELAPFVDRKVLLTLHLRKRNEQRYNDYTISNMTWNNLDPGLGITLKGDMFSQARKVMGSEIF